MIHLHCPSCISVAILNRSYALVSCAGHVRGQTMKLAGWGTWLLRKLYTWHSLPTHTWIQGHIRRVHILAMCICVGVSCNAKLLPPQRAHFLFCDIVCVRSIVLVLNILTRIFQTISPESFSKIILVLCPNSISCSVPLCWTCSHWWLVCVNYPWEFTGGAFHVKV